MGFLTCWCVRLGLLLACIGGCFYFYATRNIPSAGWTLSEHIFQTLGAALFAGGFGFFAGLFFDVLGLVFRSFRKFSRDMREEERRISGYQAR